MHNPFGDDSVALGIFSSPPIFRDLGRRFGVKQV